MSYLDYAATSPILPEVKKAMLDAMDNLPGNASALHTPGHYAKNAIENARKEIAKLINAKPEEIIFTSGGSESNNMIMHTFAGHEIITSEIEHPSVLESAKLYRGSKKPKLISHMLANNELGTVFPIKDYCKKTHNEDARFHTDATQALGKIPIDVKDLDVDYMTISAHKIGGPVGIGALYVKKGVPIKPLIVGGHQENKLRAGTYNTVGIVGFGAAAKYANDHKTWEIYAEKIRPLRDNLAERILKDIKGSRINTYQAHPQDGEDAASDPATADVASVPDKCLSTSLPNILNVSFRAAEGESIQLYLDANDITVSTGSACAAGDIKPSHVLMAVTHNAEIAHSSIRFSLGLNTTKKDIDHVMQVLPGIIERLQGISTL